MKHLNLLRSIRAVLAVTAATTTSLVSGQALVQEEEDIAEQGLITVTGSRIRRVDIETPQPVTVISREEIDATGLISVADVLRQNSLNTFGSPKERSGSSAQSQSLVSLRGLGEERTLVLLDGRRMAGSPSSSEGASQNLNYIPFAAIERIEILRDGASAIYGSDAVGGVINIILRRDYEGVHFSTSVSRPSQTGGDENTYGVVGGISSGKGNITFSLDRTERDIVFDADRSFTLAGLSAFGFPPGMIIQGAGIGTIGTFADPRCPADLNSDPLFPNSVVEPFEFVFPFGTFVSSVCRFNYTATSAQEASIDRDSIFINANYQVTEDIGMFARGTFTRNESFGRYAPAPVVGGVPFAPTLSAANPNNPTAPGAVAFNPAHLPAIPCDVQVDGLTPCNDYSQIDFDGDRVADIVGPFDLTLLYRNIPGGNRIGTVTDDYYDYLLGFEGSLDYFGGMEWTVAGQYSSAKVASKNDGLLFQSFLQDALDDGSFDVFGVNGPTDPATAQSFLHEGFDAYKTRFAGADASLSWDLFQLNNGPVPIVIGAEYQDEKFSQNFDAQNNAGNVTGGVPQPDSSAGRTVFAMFAETQIPVFSNVELNLAVRRDDYNDFGTTINPKASVGYRPFDSLLLRASWGQGFRAPTFSELYEPAQIGTSFPQDVTVCTNAGDTDMNGIPDIDEDPMQWPPQHPCARINVAELRGGNSTLQPETSESLNAGFVWSPSDDLTLSFDYYDIEIDEQPTGVDIDFLFEQELQLNMGGLQGFDTGPTAIRRDAMGNVISVENRIINLAGIDTNGFDVGVRYQFSLASLGDFSTQFSGSKVNNFVGDAGTGNGFERIPGEFQADWRATLATSWSRGDLSASLIGNALASVSDGDGDRLGSFVTWDIQFSWATPWNGAVTIGARNLFDEDPPLTMDGQYINQLHDVYGRVPYVRYEQDL